MCLTLAWVHKKEENPHGNGEIKIDTSEPNINKCFQHKLSQTSLFLIAWISVLTKLHKATEDHLCRYWGIIRFPSMKNDSHQFIASEVKQQSGERKTGEKGKPKFKNIKCIVKCLTHHWQHLHLLSERKKKKHQTIRVHNIEAK